MHYLVAGAGYTGRRIIAGLPRDSVYALGRSVPDSIPAARRRQIDLDESAGGRVSLPEPYRMVYTIPPARDALEDDRLKRLLECLENKPDRIVYFSTSGVYGDREGAIVTENDAPSPLTDRAKRRVAAETLLSEWCGDHDVSLVVLRVPGIYGPGRLGLERLRDGMPQIAISEAGPGNRIHVDDLAGCAIVALQDAVPAGVYNVGDGNYMSTTEFSRLVASLAGVDAAPEVSMQEAKRTFSDMRLSFLRESRRIDTTKMRNVLGFEPRYADPAKGIRASLSGQ